MPIGKLAWSSATGAQLWEIWGRHKRSFAGQAVILLIGLIVARWKAAASSEIGGAVLSLIALGGFVVGHLQLLASFAYIEADARTVKLGFPARLLLKPIGTTRLVAVPMLCGGAVTLGAFLVWVNWILRPIGLFIETDLLWVGSVQLSFFWWLQALGWSLPARPGRSLVMMTVAIGHLVVGLLPRLMTDLNAGTCWFLLALLFVGAWIVARQGLSLMRQGMWENSPSVSALLSRPRPSANRSPQKTLPFRSAFHAQFWLEWRCQGALLPTISGWIALVVIPIVFVILRHLGDNSLAGAPETGAPLLIALVLPLALAGVLATPMAKFDPLQSSGELPLYIAVRPMTNGGFVVAKLAMALASSVVTWVVSIAVAAFWLVALGRDALLDSARNITPYGTVGLVVGYLPLLLLLILFTWKSLVAGIGAGLTGRAWIVALFSVWRTACQLGLIVLVFLAKLDPGLQETLWRWLPWFLGAALVLKVAGAVTSFVVGRRRKAITTGAIVWISGAWTVGGIFLTAYSGLICHSAGKSALWPMAALASFLVLPLTDLAIAPLSMKWNRHR